MNKAERDALRKLLGDGDESGDAPEGEPPTTPPAPAGDPPAPPADPPEGDPTKPPTPREQEADGFAKVKAALEKIPEQIAGALAGKPPEPKPETVPAQGNRLARFFGWPDKEISK